MLSNVYLNPSINGPFQMVRYADDFVILCRTREEAEAALALVQAWTSEAGLTLHPEKTRIVDAETEGFDFLGYHFRAQYRWPRLKKLRTTIRAKTKRAHGHSLAYIIEDVNATLRGWFEFQAESQQHL